MRIEPSLRGLLTMFFRQFGKFFITFFIIISGALFYILHATPVYDSAGTVLIRFGNGAQPDVSKSDQNQQDLTPNERREMIESYTKILQSHDLLLSLIGEFGVEKVYPGLDSVSKEIALEMAYNKFMKGDLVVKTGIQSNIIEVHIFNSNPRLAPQMLKRLFEQFIVRQADVFNQPQTLFIQEQVKHATVELEKAQKGLQDYKETNGLSSVEEEMNRLLQEKSDAKTVALRSIDEAQNRVDELRSKENQLLMYYQSDSPSVKRVRESLGVAIGQLRMKQADLKAGTVGGTENATTLAPHINDIDKRMKLLETQRSQFNDLYRQVQIAEENYRTYTAKLEEARIKENLNEQNITRISILDEPTLPLAPIKPNKTFIMVLSLMGGLILALGLAVGAESMDERFSRPEQISQILDVPVMASFSFKRIRRKKKNG